jgi:hypothetical protein
MNRSVCISASIAFTSRLDRRIGEIETATLRSLSNHMINSQPSGPCNRAAAFADRASIRTLSSPDIGVEGFNAQHPMPVDQACQCAVDLIGDHARAPAAKPVCDVVGAEGGGSPE